MSDQPTIAELAEKRKRQLAAIAALNRLQPGDLGYDDSALSRGGRLPKSVGAWISEIEGHMPDPIQIDPGTVKAVWSDGGLEVTFQVTNIGEQTLGASFQLSDHYDRPLGRAKNTRIAAGKTVNVVLNLGQEESERQTQIGVYMRHEGTFKMCDQHITIKRPDAQTQDAE